MAKSAIMGFPLIDRAAMERGVRRKYSQYGKLFPQVQPSLISLKSFKK